jgi:hypothetical protein
MLPGNYDLAKARMADRIREAEGHRLVQQAKAAAREQRKAARAQAGGGTRRPSWWFARNRVPCSAPSRSTL